MKIDASRPLLIAIGPASVSAVRAGHTDLELADLLLVDSEDIRELPALRASGMFDRSVIVCLFDPVDESLWSTAASVAQFVRGSATLPLWFVCAGPEHQLARLARHLGVCVIDRGDVDALTVALTPVACCSRTGLVGFDALNLAAFAEPGRVGRALALPLRCDVQATNCLVVLRSGRNVALREINDVCSLLSAALKGATMMVAAPYCDLDESLQVTSIVW